MSSLRGVRVYTCISGVKRGKLRRNRFRSTSWEIPQQPKLKDGSGSNGPALEVLSKRKV